MLLDKDGTVRNNAPSSGFKRKISSMEKGWKFLNILSKTALSKDVQILSPPLTPLNGETKCLNSRIVVL